MFFNVPKTLPSLQKRFSTFRKLFKASKNVFQRFENFSKFLKTFFDVSQTFQSPQKRFSAFRKLFKASETFFDVSKNRRRPSVIIVQHRFHNRIVDHLWYSTLMF